MWAWVGILAVMTTHPGSEASAEPTIAAPVPVSPALPRGLGLSPSTPVARAAVIRRSVSVRGLGARLAARIRAEGPVAPQHFIAHSLDENSVREAGGQVSTRLGPLVAGILTGEELLRLAPAARFIDAPAPLRPALDIARDAVEGQPPDQGDGFERKYRGEGVLIAVYDTGLDLRHPDLREIDGPTRAHAIWDQELVGSPPPGSTVGHVCTGASLVDNTCAHRDSDGHGTMVTSLAASGAPQYRGLAPNAGLIVAASRRFDLLLPTLTWFQRLAAELGQPMVINLSLSGQEGPHDGTSLEAQAIDAIDHLVVVAAGNEGQTSVHASTILRPQQPRQVSLRFPSLVAPRDRRAVVDIWADDDGLPLSVRFRIMATTGEVIGETSPISSGNTGRTETLDTPTATLARVELDPEAAANPFNQRQHVRVDLTLPTWDDQRRTAVIEVQGQGRVDLWVDTPPLEAGLVRFDDILDKSIEGQFLGDTELTISDISTASEAIAVAAFVSRTSFSNDQGVRRTVEGTLGTIAAFTSHGPPAEAGANRKPELAAPGSLLIGALSRDFTTIPDFERVSDLYRAKQGTSMASAIVAGAGAVLLGARPELTPSELKELLLRGAAPAPDDDPRWGAGRLDVTRSLELALDVDRGGCRTPAGVQPHAPVALWCLVLLWILYRHARL